MNYSWTVLVLTVTVSFNLWSFTLNNNVDAAFDSEEVSINLSSSSTCINTGKSTSQILGYLEKAIDEFWNTVPTSNLRLKKGTLVSKGSDFESDPLCQGGINSPCTPNGGLTVSDGIFIACNDNIVNFASTSIAAATLTNNIEGTAIKGALILLNDRTGSQLASLDDGAFISVIAHEIGHAIGLGHSPEKENLMYYSTVTKRESLGWDDIEGTTYLYPKRDKLFGLIGCAPSGFAERDPEITGEAVISPSHLRVTKEMEKNETISALFSLLLGLLAMPFIIITLQKIKSRK
ncbi:MAG: matrixin family metalloprotease [Bacteriovoracaceae bacterium]|jgi:hypothetical protein|nr:matrixin family metalloprotease [Bacteriovoracaceae bacterium]